jgi:hypothetical protein
MFVLGSLIALVNPWGFSDWQYWVNFFIVPIAFLMGAYK